jgi:predicted component of type VI protein secretion system
MRANVIDVDSQTSLPRAGSVLGQQLRPGDRITVGCYVVVVELQEPAPTRVVNFPEVSLTVRHQDGVASCLTVGADQRFLLL